MNRMISLEMTRLGLTSKTLQSSSLSFPIRTDVVRLRMVCVNEGGQKGPLPTGLENEMIFHFVPES